MKTDKIGEFSFDYTLTRIGENTITATYEGSNFCNEATESITVEVKPIATTIVIDTLSPVTKGTQTTITGTVTDENGDAVANTVVKIMKTAVRKP